MIFRNILLFFTLFVGLISYSTPILGDEVSTVPELQAVIDDGFVDDGMIRMHPPGATYNETLPMMTMGAVFPASFLQNAEATTEYGNPRYTIEVSEAEAPPYTRTWKSSNGEVLHTSTPPSSYDPHGWVLAHFPPPDYLSPEELADYVHDRRPGRRTLHITLIYAADLPVWEQALADEATALALDDPDPQELYVGMARPLSDGSGIELLTQVPAEIGVVGLYHKADLLDPNWQQSGSVNVVTQPFWVKATTTENIGFWFVANHSQDSDGDGIIDALEDLIEGTDPNNVDSDGDGLTDGDELWIHGTDALNADSDGDGLTDGFEVAHGGNPHGPSGIGNQPDSLLDEDGDGLTALEEQARGTDPTLVDTDGDGVNDPEDAVGYDAFFTFDAAPEVQYAVVNLGDVDDPYYNFAVTNQGMVARYGGEYDEFYDNHFFIYNNGEPMEYMDASLIDINNSGSILFQQGNDLYLASDSVENLGPVYEKVGTDVHEHRHGYALEDDGTAWVFRRTFNEEWLFTESMIRGNQSVEGTAISTFIPDEDLDETIVYLSYNEGLAATSPTGTEYDWWEEFTHSYVQQVTHQGDWFSVSYLVSFQSIINVDPHFTYPYSTIRRSWEFTRPDPITFTFSDGTQYTVEYDNGYLFKARNTTRLPGDDRLWKVWQGTDFRSVLTPDTPDLGQPLRDGGIEERPLWINNIADNGLLVQNTSLWRNGRILTNEDLVDKNSEWKDLHIQSISDDGTFLAGYATEVELDGLGNPTSVELGQKVVLLVPVELNSSDRFLQGKFRIPENWTNVSMTFTHKTSGQNLGTYTNLEPGAVTDVKIYGSPEEFFSDEEMEANYLGTLDENSIHQEVTFARDPEDPQSLEFATIFDDTGLIEIKITFGPNQTVAIATHLLEERAEMSDFIYHLSERVGSIEVPGDTEPDVIAAGTASLTETTLNLAAVPQPNAAVVSQDGTTLISVTDAQNGAENLNTMGLFFDETSVQHRGLLAKVLWDTPKSYSLQYIAYSKGFIDGFWVALKGEKEAVVEVWNFFKDDPLGRSSAMFAATREVIVELREIPLEDLSEKLSEMTKNLTDDLYSNAEDQLPWSPIREDSSPDVKRYMEGFVAGTVAEGIAVSSLGVGLVTKSSTAIRGTLAASRQGKVALTMLSNIRKATNSAVDVLSQLARSKADAAKFGAIGRYLGKTDLPSGRNAAEAFAEALPGKTLLSRKVLTSWDEAWPDLDEARRITRYQRCVMSVAELKDIMGDALSDDALEAFGKLQPRLFVNPDVDDADVFRQFTELFDVDTPGGKVKLNEFLEDSKAILEDHRSALLDGGGIDPPDRGFITSTQSFQEISEGTILQRYGHPNGDFLTLEGTPKWAVALPPSNQGALHKYRVVSDFSADMGRVAPWFGQSGGGIQIDLLNSNKTVSQLVLDGVLEDITP